MLLAVHIADGPLDRWVLAFGFLGAALVAAPGLIRTREDEIPRLALMTAAFFISSIVRLPLPLATSVHLLLNGLLGLVLGARAGLAILVGLVLQFAFLGHGGLSTIGINTCVLTLPALATAGLYRLLDRMPFIRRPIGRGMLVALSALLLVGSLAVTVEIIVRQIRGEGVSESPSALWTLHPMGWGVIAGVSVAAAWAESRWQEQPAFALGCLLGIISVMMTIGLLAAVLFAGIPNVEAGPILVIAVAHIPVAAVEGIVLGSAIAFLAQVRPELLRR